MRVPERAGQDEHDDFGVPACARQAVEGLPPGAQVPRRTGQWAS